MDKTEITKIALQPKVSLAKKEKKNQQAQFLQKEPKKKKGLKIEPKKPKTIWPKLNPIIACLLGSLASINYISLISTPNWNMFEALNSRLPKLQNHMWYPPKISQELAPILSWSHRHMLSCSPCSLDSISYNSLVQLQIAIHLKRWIHEFLSFKTIGGLS